MNQNNVVDQTPLHYASASGGKEMSDHLQAKMRIWRRWITYGKTPLDLTNMNGGTEFATLLPEYGAKIGEDLDFITI